MHEQSVIEIKIMHNLENKTYFCWPNGVLQFASVYIPQHLVEDCEHWWYWVNENIFVPLNMALHDAIPAPTFNTVGVCTRIAVGMLNNLKIPEQKKFAIFSYFTREKAQMFSTVINGELPF